MAGLPTLVSPGGKVVFAPPGKVNRDIWHEMDFYSPELAAQLTPEASP